MGYLNCASYLTEEEILRFRYLEHLCYELSIAYDNVCIFF